MEIFGFVPARGGSKGIPRKNLQLLNGKPLIAYTIKEALASSITRLLVSTDSEEIAATSLELGADVPFLRPDDLARDNSIIEDAMIDALKCLEHKEGYRPDIIVLLHPTTPLRRTRHIDEAVLLLKEKGADAVVSVSAPMEHPGDMVYWNDRGEMRFLLDFMPGKTQRQDYPDYQFLNGVVYAFTRESLMRNKSRYGEKTIPYFMRQIESIDIDSMDDLLIAEALLQKGHNE